MAEILTIETIRKIVGKLSKKQADNALSVVIALNEYGERTGLDQPHRLAQYLAQVLHESGTFKYDREIWGPTAAQKRYEGRNDLGNIHPGDGSKFRGHGPIQVTGRHNHRKYAKWAKDLDLKAPNFEEEPELINTDPWEGLSAIWYWDVGNPEGKTLNRYADHGDNEMITKRINGGLNGYQDRLDWYAKVALVLLGYGSTEIEKFQKDRKMVAPDGVAGPKTRSEMHKALLALTKGAAEHKDTQTAPVVEEKKVVPPKIEKEVKQKTNWLTQIFGAGGVLGGIASWLSDADWQTIGTVAGVGLVAAILVLIGGQWAVRRVKAIRKEVESS